MSHYENLTTFLFFFKFFFPSPSQGVVCRQRVRRHDCKYLPSRLLVDGDCKHTVDLAKWWKKEHGRGWQRQKRGRTASDDAGGKGNLTVTIENEKTTTSWETREISTSFPLKELKLTRRPRKWTRLRPSENFEGNHFLWDLIGNSKNFLVVMPNLNILILSVFSSFPFED